MKLKTMLLGASLLVALGCSTDSDTTQENQYIPEITDLVNLVADTQYDNTPIGKYTGVFGHYLNKDLHGKIYINAGLDTRYSALIQLVNGQELKFKGKKITNSKHTVIFTGRSGSFQINFANYLSPLVSNVNINGEDEEAYISLVKSQNGADVFIRLGTYVDSTDPAFFGNWDLMGDPLTTEGTPFTSTIPGVPFLVDGNAVTQEINTLVLSHTGATSQVLVNGMDDFDPNAAIVCAPIGVSIPSSEPVLIDIIVTGPISLGDIADAISAGGQTSMIIGNVASWSLNHTTQITIPFGDIPESYVTNDCNATTSGTWSWNGRSGTLTVL